MIASNRSNMGFAVLNVDSMKLALRDYPHLENELVGIAVAELPGRIETIKHLVGREDEKKLNFQLHNLKTTFGALGCRPLYERIQKLEVTGFSGSTQHSDLLRDLIAQTTLYVKDLVSFQHINGISI